MLTTFGSFSSVTPSANETSSQTRPRLQFTETACLRSGTLGQSELVPQMHRDQPDAWPKVVANPRSTHVVNSAGNDCTCAVLCPSPTVAKTLAAQEPWHHGVAMSTARFRLSSALRRSGPFCSIVLAVAGCQSANSGNAFANGGAGTQSDASGAAGNVTNCDGDAAVSDAASPPKDCQVVIEEHPPVSFQHITDCSPISYDTNPPSGGDHYSDWAAFQNYDFPVPAGFLVHDLEHGAIVIWYNCPCDCPNEVAQAKAMIDALPTDDSCTGYSAARRITLSPYPDLTVRWAASAWGWTLRANCFDPVGFANFYTAHFGQGREQTCAPGTAILPNTCH